MTPFQSVALIARVVCIVVLLQELEAISCYQCHSSGVDNGCGSMANPSAPGITIASNCSSCTMYITTDANAYAQNITRACEANPQRNGTTCILQNFIEGNGTTTVVRNETGIDPATIRHQSQCYCHSDGCNNLPMYYSGSVDCYVCSSADYIGNGCGVTLNPNSLYVQRAQKCVACYTTISKSLPTAAGVLRYRRTCEFNAYLLDGCSGPGNTYPCHTKCTTNFCNGVAPLQSSQSFLRWSLLFLVCAVISRRV